MRAQSRNRFNFLAWGIIALLAATAGPVLVLRWAPPPASAFMVLAALEARWEKRTDFHIAYRWVDWPRISPHAVLAVMASEDQKFPIHKGFDTESIADAWRDRKEGRRLRGASSISQQTAKNLFLWPGRSFLRKGIEAYFTVLIELLWSKQRIIEVYLNVAQFGPEVFGVAAAAQRYFGKPPWRLSRQDAALLAAVLPNPLKMRPDRPSDYVRQRAGWILDEMERLEQNRTLQVVEDR
jgi:monofunctional biosynthetic peptidoglycan transglycosylase